MGIRPQPGRFLMCQSGTLSDLAGAGDRALALLLAHSLVQFFLMADSLAPLHFHTLIMVIPCGGFGCRTLPLKAFLVV